MNIVATVNFANPAITATGTTGEITLYRDQESETNTERYAILLCQNPVNEAAVTIGNDNFTVDVPKVEVGKYIGKNGELVIDNTAAAPAPEGAIIGKFSVSDTKKVYFSQGNLQYRAKGGEAGDASATAASGESVGGTRRFAEHQWDNYWQWSWQHCPERHADGVELPLRLEHEWLQPRCPSLPALEWRL